MGWKTFKELFEITHNVHVNLTKNALCIGSDAVSALVEIDMDTGAVCDRYGNVGGMKFLHQYYPKLAEASEAARLIPIQQEDVFERSIAVYYFDDDLGECIELQCEDHGWPNVTHDGRLQFSNQYFPTEYEAESRAKSVLEGNIDFLTESIVLKEKELASMNERFDKMARALYQLNLKHGKYD